jgi:predicted DNA-binding transcriptional regulator AlpA
MDATNPHLQPALTIPDLCRIMHISEPTYYKMRRKGYGPKETRIERTVTITFPHFLEWKEKIQGPAIAAEELKQLAHEQGKRAGAAAARSPQHVSNTRRKARKGKRG